MRYFIHILSSHIHFKNISSLLISIICLLLLVPFELFPQQSTLKYFNTTIAFIENKGQIIDQNNKPNPGVLYLLNTPGFNVQLRKGGFSYDLFRISNTDQRFLKSEFSASRVSRPASRDSTPVITYHRIDFDLLHANPNPVIETSEPSSDYLNYYGSFAPENGITNVRQYKNITYKNIYPNIDLEFVTNESNRYKYNFIIHPGGKVEDIRLKISGPDRIAFTKDSLLFRTSLGGVKEQIPVSYFLSGNSYVGIKTSFKRISENVFSFSVDQTVPENSTVTIDPTAIRLWGTYYGGYGGEWGISSSADKNGNIFISGTTQSPNNIATAGAYQSTKIGLLNKGFLTKFNASGVRQWGTYYCGDVQGTETLEACVVDSRGNIYIDGMTNSDSGIATPGAHQTIYGGGTNDSFLAKFSTNGERLWATYYGGSDADEIWGMWGGSPGALATDRNGNVFIAGETGSDTGIATPGSFQQMPGGGFIAKFDSMGVRQWGTYYGGNYFVTQFCRCSADSAGNIYATGVTGDTDNIATPGAYQTVYGGGSFDAFLVAFDPTGQRLWGTYYGGILRDEGDDVTTDGYGNIYLVGTTKSTSGIASSGSFQQTYGGGSYDGFVAKFNNLGQRIWASYYGGTLTDQIFNVASDQNGNIFFCGYTNSLNNISTPNSYQPDFAGNNDAFFVKFDSTGQRTWGSYFGGAALDISNSINYIADDTIYLEGYTTSTDNISTPDGHQITIGGNQDAFLEKFLECWPIDTANAIVGPADVCQNTTTVFYSTQPLSHAVNYQWTLPPGITLQSAGNLSSIIVDISPTASSGKMWVKGLNKCGDSGDSTSLYITVHQRPVPIISGHDTTCSGTGKVYSTAPGKSNYQWGISSGGVITGGGTASDYSVTVTWNNTGLQTVQVNYTDTNGCEGLAPTLLHIFVIPGPPVSVTVNASANNVCAGTPVTFTATSVNGGPNPAYQWKVNGINAGTNNQVYTYAPLNGNIVSCVVTSDDTCSSNNPASSNQVIMVIISNSVVGVSIAASANPVCAGTTVIFTATPINGGTMPSYQWKVNGIGVGTDSPVYSYIPSNGDLVSCTMTSSETCTINNPASSIQYPVSVNPNLPVSVSISASSNPFCQGTSVTFTATPTNGGAAPSYQWKVNGVNVGPNNPVYSYSPNNGDIVTCVLTSNIACPIGNPAISNSITMIVNANLPAGINIIASANPFCPGNSVTFTATPVNGGSTPVYQWKVNGANAGINSSIFTYNPISGDLVSCILTSNLTCVTGNPATSNTIIMSGTLAPIVTFTLCNDTITTTNAKPFKLKGGIPLGGTYSGAGVAGGIFNPAIAGAGNHQITYTYMNAALCSASAHSFLHTFNPSNLPCGSPLTDIRDNMVYQTVQIGTQCWLAEDLNYGIEIPSNIHQRDNCIAEKYHNPASSIQHPASVYQWDEIMNYDETISNQGLCPPAWHVPTEADWNTLFANYISNGFAASPLKYSGFSGFNALLSGARHINKSWDWPGFATFFWSSTSHGSEKAWAHGMNDPDPSVSFYPSFRNNAFAVRCLKDN